MLNLREERPESNAALLNTWLKNESFYFEGTLLEVAAKLFF